MKNKHLPTASFALASLTALAGAAHAQSSVTLFGRVDVAVRHVSTAGTSLSKLDSSGMGSSQFGVRGTEDLGGGMSAAFWLESEVFPDTGTSAAKFWGRQAWVALRAPQGELRLGRDYSPTFALYAAYDPFFHNGVGSTAQVANYGLNTNASTAVRADNSVSYLTPSTLGGWFAKLQVSASEGVAGGKSHAARFGYADGPLNISAGLSEADAGPAGSTAVTGKYRVYGISGFYDVGPVRLVAQYLRSTSNVTVPSRTADLTIVGASWTVVDAHVVKFKHAQLSQDYKGRLDAIGWTNYLSKRTALYATYAHVSNKGPYSASTVGGAPAAVAGREQSSSGFELGLNHSF
jgi:predicted porin